ncbi:hypothetical protein PHMEG_0009179 [Phytophthora megakarya]|uniref:Uncharacterized protein n=1 Tax=Phytophthora megakarya TaxID=4795 RepID=A0A225WGU5_9STRA|nr:hypothetical protein PHMEG_0009179 [Phytophthora megakarya]
MCCTRGDGREPVLINDHKRNWTKETTRALVQAWGEIVKGERDKAEKTSGYNERIYKGGQKAIEEKMSGFQKMYRFICDLNAKRIRRST